jgi:hypothetical protein
VNDAAGEMRLIRTRHAGLAETLAEDLRAVGGQGDRLGGVLAYLAQVDVERRRDGDALGLLPI